MSPEGVSKMVKEVPLTAELVEGIAPGWLALFDQFSAMTDDPAQVNDIFRCALLWRILEKDADAMRWRYGG